MNKNFFTRDEHQALNEIIFQNRNKEYGAYALRNEANTMLKKALFVGVALFAVVAIVPLVVSQFKGEHHVISDGGTAILIDLERPKDQNVEKQKPIVVPPKPDVPLKTQSLTPPEPTRNPPVETTINQKVDDAIISTVTTPGQAVTNPNQNIGVSSDVETKPAIDNTPKPDLNVIPTSVDVEANFNGGIEGFRSKVLNNFDTTVVTSESGEIVKAVVTFVVERDGSISNIKASGVNADFNKEAEKVIKNIKGKWNPAKLGGQNVRSYFKFPISMQFE